MATDVMNDRNYLYALLQRGPRDKMAQMAQQRLDDMNRQDALRQQANEFTFRQAGLDETRQARMDALKEAEAGRTERASVRDEIRKQADEDRKTQGLVAAMTALQYDQTPEGKKALAATRAEYLKRMGVNVEGGAAPKATVGEYGPGGAQVRTPAGTTATAAPTAVDTAKAAFGGGGGGVPITKDVNFIANTPAGYDYNLGTGEYVPKSAPGFVNGLQINPGQTYAQAKAGIPAPGAAANVPTNENVLPTPAPYALPNTNPLVATTVPPTLAVAQPTGLPAPPPGAPGTTGLVGPINFNTGAAPAATPGLPSPNPTPAPQLTPEQLAALKRQPAPVY